MSSRRVRDLRDVFCLAFFSVLENLAMPPGSFAPSIGTRPPLAAPSCGGFARNGAPLRHCTDVRRTANTPPPSLSGRLYSCRPAIVFQLPFLPILPRIPGKFQRERQIRSVANAACHDGEEFPSLAAAARLRSTVTVYPLNEANAALDDLKHSRFNGEAILKVN